MIYDVLAPLLVVAMVQISAPKAHIPRWHPAHWLCSTHMDALLNQQQSCLRCPNLHMPKASRTAWQGRILPRQMATSHGLPTKSRSLQANSSFIPWKVSHSSVVQGQPHAAKPVMTCKCFQTAASNLESMCDFAFQSTLTYILPMEKAQLGWSKDLKSWDVYHINWYSPKFVHTTKV